MVTINKKAVARHRKRRRRQGVVRVEVQVPKEDVARVRALSAVLRDPARAPTARTEIQRIVGPTTTALSFKELLASVPLGDLEIERIRDFPREIDL